MADIVRIADEVFRPRGMDAEQPRSKGLHLSEVLYRPEGLIEEIFKKKYAPGFDEIAYTRMGFGLGFEYAIQDSLSVNGRAVQRAGEYKHRGIWVTPDFIDQTSVDGEPEVFNREIKVTWANIIKKDGRGKEPEILDGSSAYWIQSKFQCSALSEAFGIPVNETRLTVFYVMGDWAKRGPEIRTYHAKFTRRELLDNADMIVNHAIMRGWLNPDGSPIEEEEENDQTKHEEV